MSELQHNEAIQQAIQEREKSREIIEKVKESSQNDYEKNIIYITAGTLVLSMTFIEKISPLATAIYIWMVITSWSFLALSLAINLFSHWYSAFLATKLQKLLNNLAITSTAINQKIDGMNKKMQALNIGTFASMFIGIFFLVLYCSNNAYNMSELENKRGDQKPSNTDTIQKGRVFSPVSDYTPITPQVQPQQPVQTPPAAQAPSTPPPADTTQR